MISSMKPDLWTSLADEVPAWVSQKRNITSVDRTVRWLDECIEKNVHAHPGLMERSSSGKLVLVDLLARAGCIKEAEAFINQMPFDPDIVVWKTLLAACKTNNNVEVAKPAAESILSIDPSNSAAHVLLCSIYASSGNWKDVARLRSLMKQNSVMKVPGQSWIEVKDKMHVFLAEDCQHPKSDHIYSLLDELWLQMLDSGFVPLRK